MHASTWILIKVNEPYIYWNFIRVYYTITIKRHCVDINFESRNTTTNPYWSEPFAYYYPTV